MKAEDLEGDVIAEGDEFRDNGDDDEEPMVGNPSESDAMFDVKLTSRYGMSYTSLPVPFPF